MVEIRFLATVDDSKCVSCGACENVCPTEAIVLPGKKEKAKVDEGKCLACPNCSGICPVDAIEMVERSESLLLGVDPTEVDQRELVELCVKAHLHPHQWLCLCTATRVRDGAAAVLKGARSPEEIALMTGTRSGCTAYCLQPALRLLKAHGVDVVEPKNNRWYDTTQTLWDVPEEVMKKYPDHFLEEDKDVFRKT
jgi:Pyruvate/2-oxoacid:ferredoxin oxidoreductase delta subunit/bacterioferritin-associated ferredoxin